MKAFFLVAALGWTSSAWGARPLAVPAPEFPAGDIWLNSPPLTLKSLRRKGPVVVAFLNTASLDSARTFKTLKLWQERYGKRGLTLIGVHSPDFEFQRDPQEAAAALKRYAIAFPVILDSDHRLWKAFENEGWPAIYLIDRSGRIIFDRLGEGRYGEFEGELREALGKKDPRDGDVVEDPSEEECGAMTPEVQLGSQRGKALHLKPTESRLIYASATNDGSAGFQGPWTADPDDLRLSEKVSDNTAFVSVIYRGVQAYAVLGAGAGRARFFIRQDDLWMHPKNAGKDIQFDDDGRSFIEAGSPRLVHLAKNANDDPHELTLVASREGSKVYAFSFSNKCLAPFSP